MSKTAGVAVFHNASQHSIDSDNTIQAFFLKDQCGQIIKTKKVLEREQDRVEKVKRAREKALNNAMEKSAKLILNERKYESNIKRHNKLMAEEDSYRQDHFLTLTEKRSEVKQIFTEHNDKLDQLGYVRYKRDLSEVEANEIRKQQKQLEQARDSFLQLRRSIEVTEKKERDWHDDFNK